MIKFLDLQPGLFTKRIPEREALASNDENSKRFVHILARLRAVLHLLASTISAHFQRGEAKERANLRFGHVFGFVR